MVVRGVRDPKEREILLAELVALEAELNRAMLERLTPSQVRLVMRNLIRSAGIDALKVQGAADLVRLSPSQRNNILMLIKDRDELTKAINKKYQDICDKEKTKAKIPPDDYQALAKFSFNETRELQAKRQREELEANRIRFEGKIWRQLTKSQKVRFTNLMGASAVVGEEQKRQGV